MELNENSLNRLARSAEVHSTTEIIERRSVDRRTEQRRADADGRRSSDHNHRLPRRLGGERRQREDRRATD